MSDHPKPDEFDPYSKWLGIAPGPRPPGPEVLLGLPAGATDRDQILDAAVKQKERLDSLTLSKHSRLADRLTKEVSAAVSLLLQRAEASQATEAARSVKNPPTAPDLAVERSGDEGPRRASDPPPLPAAEPVLVVGHAVVDEDASAPPLPATEPVPVVHDSEIADAVPVAARSARLRRLLATCLRQLLAARLRRGFVTCLRWTIWLLWQPVRLFDWILRAIVGRENAILHNFLRLASIVVLAFVATLALKPEKVRPLLEPFFPSAQKNRPAAPESFRLRPIGPQTVEAGQTLTVVVLAENAPRQGRGVRFDLSLQTSALGAKIDPATGRFTWTPPESQRPGKYDATVYAMGPEGRKVQADFAITVTGPSGLAALRPPPPVPVPVRTIVSASGAAPTLPLADLPPLEEVAAVWIPSADAKSASIGAAREAVLQGIEERSWDSVLAVTLPAGAASQRFPATGTGSIPQRFILTGRLAAVRVGGGKSVVYVQGAATGLLSASDASSFFSGQRPMEPAMGGIVVPVAAVEFDGETLALPMSDFRVGEAVRVVVERLSNRMTDPFGPPPPPQASTARSPFGAKTPWLSQIVEELRLVHVTGTTMAFPCWGFRGEGLELAGRTETWIDAKLGRVGTAAEAMIRRAPGFLMRTGQISKGTAGRLTAEMDVVVQIGQDVVAYLAVPRTVEGSLRCEAHFGSTLQRAELARFPRGAMVELAATVDDPLTGVKPPSIQDRQPVGTTGYVPPSLPTVWTQLRVNCSQIRLQGQPATLLDARSPRQPNVAVSAVSAVTPATVQADPAKVLGQEIAWSGKLYQVRCRSEETHLVAMFSEPVQGIRIFEAYTDDRAFVEELADYVDLADSYGEAETVTVTGTVCMPNASRIRLLPGVPLLKIKQVECVNRPGSRAVVGQKRDRASFRASTLHTGLAAILRAPPAPGTEVKFAGRYSMFNESGKSVRVSPGNAARSSNSTEITFAGVDRAVFADYWSGAVVEVTGTLSEQPYAPANQPKITGKTIVRKSNPRSLVTATGRETPPLDLTAEKRQWSKVKFTSKQSPGVRLQASGVFGGYTDEKSHLKVRITNLYFGYERIDLLCAADSAARQFLDSLSPDDEVLFEFSPADGTSYRRTLALQWMARLGDPDNKIPFQPVKIGLGRN